MPITPGVICGPDTIETEAQVRETIEAVKAMALRRGLPWVMKCSFDKANRSTLKGFRVLG